MAGMRLARTVVRDIPFNLLASPGGSYTDDKDFTDGLTAPQWPSVEFWTEPLGAGVNKTALFAYDITSTTITSATHKHPTGSTGIWRKLQGRYRIRVEPQVSLAYLDYYMRVEFEPGTSSSYAEDHIVTVISPGDITFFDVVFGSITTDEVEVGITTSLDDDDIQALLNEAATWAQGRLITCGIDVEALEELPPSVRIAILMYARGLIFDRDASSGYKTSMRQEGTKRVGYAGQSSKDADGMRGRAADELLNYCLSFGSRHRSRLSIVERSPDAGGGLTSRQNGCC